MPSKTTTNEVQQSIAILRQKQLADWADVKAQLAATGKQLTPGYLVSHAIGNAIHIPQLGKKIATVAAGLVIQKTTLAGKPWLNILGTAAAFILGSQLTKSMGNAQILGKIIIKKLVSKQK